MSSYDNYATIRDSKNLTDYKVAKDTGIGTATFSNWKNGKYQPKQDKVAKIADYLGVEITDILDVPTTGKIHVRGITSQKNHDAIDSLFQDALRSKIDELTKAIVGQALGTLCNDDLFWITRLFTKLNEEGKNKFYDYLEDLLLIGKYTETGEPYIVDWEDVPDTQENTVFQSDVNCEKI